MNVVIIGATSTIAEACASLWAKEGHSLYLLARNEEKLAANAADLSVRYGANVHTHLFDARNIELIPKLLHEVVEDAGSVDLFLIAHGTLPDQTRCENDSHYSVQELGVNAVSVITCLNESARLLQKQGKGKVAVITSVAGDRGRQSNYLYGAAKSMVSTYISGMQHRFYASGVHIIDIKPGFIDSAMTRHIENKGVLWTSAPKAAELITKAIAANKAVAYIPGFWRLIMLIICSLPDFIFNRTKL